MNTSYPVVAPITLLRQQIVMLNLPTGHVSHGSLLCSQRRELAQEQGALLLRDRLQEPGVLRLEGRDQFLDLGRRNVAVGVRRLTGGVERRIGDRLDHW